MTTQEALERAKELARERKELREAGYDRIEELVDKYGEVVFEAVPISECHYGAVAVRYGAWRPPYLPNEPYKEDYLIVFAPNPDAPYSKRRAWPLRGNLRTPSEAWRIVEAIEKTVNK